MELENPDSETTKLIRVEIQKAFDEDRSEAIVLGCAGMIDLASAKEFGIPPDVNRYGTSTAKI